QRPGKNPGHRSDHMPTTMAHRSELQRGFSLIECLTVLGLLALMMGMAVPGFQQMIANQTMRAQVDRLHVSLALARTQALTRMDHTIVCSSADGLNCDGSGQWHRGWIVFVDHNRNRRLDPGEALLDRGEAMPEGLQATGPAARSRVRFQHMGYSPGTNLTIRFCDQRGAAHGSALIVSNVGRPRQVSGGLPPGSCSG
ncbi:MAG: GspH/FimT family pseudopilin, partial [Xanthomonadales bacterium]|nr:GspH/FimT family pseudopilin [Xanthomonadales bacterium]